MKTVLPRFPGGQGLFAYPSARRACVMLGGGLSLTAAQAYDILAKLERDGNPVSGPSEQACDFCENKALMVTTGFLTGYPPPEIPAAEPPNSQISGTASADIRTGQMRGHVFASAYGHFEEHKMGFATRLQEKLTVVFPPGLPESLRVVKVVGRGHGRAVGAGVAVASVGFSLEVNGVQASAGQTSPGAWAILDGEGKPGVTAGLEGEGCRLGITVKPTQFGEVTLTAVLSGTTHAIGRLGVGAGVAEVNALNTGDLAVELPAGATYTSSSGAFLSALPEPTIDIALEGGDLVISYTGVLESSPELAEGKWVPVVGAASPHRVPLSLGGVGFFRARTP